MNTKEQFYHYMNSMSPEDIQECLQKVILLARDRSVPLASVDEATSSKIKRLQVSHRVWFQHALVNVFGNSNAREITLGDLGQAAIGLFAESRVVEYVAHVNKTIDEELNKDSQSMDFAPQTIRDEAVFMGVTQMAASAESVRYIYITLLPDQNCVKISTSFIFSQHPCCHGVQLEQRNERKHSH